MKTEEVKKLCDEIRKKFRGSMKPEERESREAELFEMGFTLLEVHLVNQARIADTLHSLLIHARNK